MKGHREVVGIIRSIEGGNIKQTSTTQTVAKVARVKSRSSTNIEIVAIDTIGICPIDEDRILGANCWDKTDGREQGHQGPYRPPSREHFEERQRVVKGPDEAGWRAIPPGVDFVTPKSLFQKTLISSGRRREKIG